VRKSATGIYPRPAQAVFAALQEGLPHTRLRISGSDPEQGTIKAQTGVTWASWGERITIAVRPTGAEQTAVSVTSRYKFQLYALAPVHRRNFDAVFGLLDWRLQTTHSIVRD
jgi:hypothetical protein